MKRVIMPFVFSFIIFLVVSCSTVQPYSDDIGLDRYMEPDSLLHLTRNPDPSIWIIDVRTPEEYAGGHIPTARNYPSGEIMDTLNTLPKYQYLILYCHSGGRASMIFDLLTDKGYTRLLDWGAISRWPYELETGD